MCEHLHRGVAQTLAWEEKLAWFDMRHTSLHISGSANDLQEYREITKSIPQAQFAYGRLEIVVISLNRRWRQNTIEE